MSVVFNWRKAKTVEVTRDRMNQIIDTLTKKYPNCEFQWSAKLTARRRMFFSGKWARSSCGGMVTVHDATYEFEDDFVIFSFNANNSVREGLESKEVFGGLQSYDMVNSFYREKFGNDQATIAAGITARKFHDEYCLVKKCVPIQIQYSNPVFRGKVISGCTKADVSSAFPSQIVGKPLPAFFGCKTEHGEIPPSEEYPFAFYTKSHHLSIYKEFSTKQWRNTMYYRDEYNQIFNDTIKKSDEITILCKRANPRVEKSIWYAYEQLYKGRKEHPAYKRTMVASIGWFQKNSNPNMSCLSAVVIARSNNSILEKCKFLNSKMHPVLFIATDSIVWQGGREDSIATDDKFLGSFTYEMHEGKFFMRGVKSYQYIDQDGKTVTKASGLKNGTDKDSIPFGELPEVEAVLKKIKIDQKSCKIVEVM